MQRQVADSEADLHPLTLKFPEHLHREYDSVSASCYYHLPKKHIFANLQLSRPQGPRRDLRPVEFPAASFLEETLAGSVKPLDCLLEAFATCGVDDLCWFTTMARSCLCFQYFKTCLHHYHCLIHTIYRYNQIQIWTWNTNAKRYTIQPHIVCVQWNWWVDDGRRLAIQLTKACLELPGVGLYAKLGNDSRSRHG